MLRGRGNVLVYGLLAVLAVLSLVVLFRLRSQFENTQLSRMDDLQRVFSNRSLLKIPSDHKIVFSDIEAEAAKYEGSGDFGAIWISKTFGTTERIVYPFYYPSIDAASISDPKLVQGQANEDLGFLQRATTRHRLVELPLIADGDRLGTLHVRVNDATLRTVNLVIFTLGAMLATSLAFLAAQFRRQEKVISATTIELEEKRRELVRLERLALAGQLSANILHDLKKPVLNIRNEAVEALNPSDGQSHVETVPAVFKRIGEQADFFLSILKEGGYDRFVRAQEEQEYVDINELLERSIALVRYEQASVTVIRELEPVIKAVLAEPVRIIQVFSNLVLNAYQAMDGRGVLRIRSFQSGPDVVVEIEDNGPGIPADRLQQVFDPFFTTKAPGQGTGLGLYIARDIIRDLGGDVTLFSETGKTRFKISFPSAE